MITFNILDLQKLSGGFTNTIIKVSPRDGSDEDAVIVRIHTVGSGLVREDLGSLATVMRVVADGGEGPPVLAEFNNGLVYGFTPGDMAYPEIYPHTGHILT